MHAPNSSRDGLPPSTDFSPAILLTSQADFRQHGELIKLLNYFGIPWRTETAADLLQHLLQSEPSSVRLFSCPNGFIELMDKIRSDPAAANFLGAQIHSVFIYGISSSISCDELKDFAFKVKASRNVSQIEIARGHRLSGIMAGLRFPARGRSRNGGLTLDVSAGRGATPVPILSTDVGAVFVETSYRGIPFFLSAGEDLISLDMELTSGVFDIREHALSVLPIVLYVKWAFAGICWEAAEANASFVLDDPLLRPRYGFLDYYRLLRLMRQHKFATTIAFIPWNWRRSALETVALFTENPAHYSIAVHGCNHTRNEFSGADLQYLFEKSQRALSLMDQHERETAIHHDRVMVFPHGVFSAAAMAAIKRTDFFATASNEVISTDETPKAVTVADVWGVALMRYSECALFTRRTLGDGVENIAFDLLIGKPALIVLHHDDCDADYQRLVELADKINALPIKVRWGGLGDVLRRSYRQRQSSPGIVEVEMYGTELLLENRCSQERQFDVSRVESDPGLIRTLTADSKPLDWIVRSDRIAFSNRLRAGEKVLIRLRYHPLKAGLPPEEAVSMRARTLLRRRICEARDNYLTPFRRSRSGLQTTVAQTTPNNRSALAGGGLAEEVQAALHNFTAWLTRYGETSWDHQSFFAGPLGRRAKALYYRRPKLGTVAVAPMIFFEAILPAGRRLYHRPIRFPIADAHYAMGFGFLFEATGQTTHLERAIHFLRVLQQARSQGFSEYCWGYPFDWVWRGGVIARDTPLITTTPYCYEAFLQVRQYDRREEWRGVLASIVRHTVHDIKDVQTSDHASKCSYTPYDTGGVINAAAYRAFLLASAAQVFERGDYWQIGVRNLNFVLENQNSDGSWPYAVGDVRDFVDHFHTCFVMKSLAKIHTISGDSRIRDSLEHGVEYYCKNLLDEEGLPKPFAKAPRLVVYKRELYDCAECINLCLLLRDRFPQLRDLLDRVLRRVLRDWMKKDGSFRSRRLHFGWDNVPMHRWGQSQMFRALAFYLCEEQGMAQRKSKEHRAEMADGSLTYASSYGP